MIYIFDSNILIEAKNRYYGLDFVPGFWEFIIRESSNSLLKSNDMVLEELKILNDELSDWVNSNQEIFSISSDNIDIQRNFIDIVNYVNTNTNFSQAEKDRFLSKADPWLIAAAIYLEGTIVTHEKIVGSNSKKVKIPNIANKFGVETIDTFDLIRKLEGKFELIK